MNLPQMEHIVILVVNASTNAVTGIGTSRDIPSAMDVITAVTDIQLHLYNTESNSLVREELMQLVKTISSADSPIEPYYIELSMDDLKDPDEQLYLNQIPTSFYLEKEQIDDLIGTVKKLLREDDDYQRLLKNIGAQAATDAPSVAQ